MGALILVVEDDLDLRETFIDALSTAGYSVIAAFNGVDALHQLRGGARPKVILLDLMMPVMDGWEFRDQQLADPALASIPVIAVSAHDDVRRFRAAAKLKKPVALNELLETVALFCQ